MMDEFKEGAREELKRADHSIFVTLKYTRTSEVIKNIVARLISAYEYAIDDVLNFALKKKKIKEIPHNYLDKAALTKKVMKGKNIKDHIELYLLMKRIDKAGYTSKEEYRRHVTLVSDIGVNVKIETLMDYFNVVKEFIMIVDEWINK